MTTHYQQVFRIAVSHSYFENGVCTGLNYVAAPESEKCMNRFGFKIRHWANGFELFVNTHQPLPQYLEYIAECTGLTGFDFYVLTTSADFFSYTDLPVNWVGQLIYDSSTAAADSESGKIILKAAFADFTVNRALACIRISFKKMVPAAGENQSPQFSIQFTSRSTQWQYYVINKSSLDLENAVIVSKSAVTFQKQGKTTLPNGEEAVWFSSSEQLIPFSEKPKYKFDLVSSAGNSGAGTGKRSSGVRTIFKSLPNASPARMAVENNNGQSQAVSPMYIYV